MMSILRNLWARVRGFAELAHGGTQRRLDGLVPLVRLLVLLIALDLRLYVRHAWESFKVVCGRRDDGRRDDEAYPSQTPRLKPEPDLVLASGPKWAQSRRGGKGTGPDMGSWITQAASRRITRTDARVTT